MKKYSFAGLTLVYLLWGCGHSHETDTSHPEAEKIQYTVYSDDWELFAEADPFVAGDTARILGHFTRLADFKPMESVPVTVTLSTGGTEIRQTVETPGRAGIYSFDIKPEKAGSGHLTFVFHSGGTEFRMEIPDVQVSATEAEAKASEHHHEEDITNCVAFTKEQSWKTGFSTGFPEFMAFGSVIKAIARVEPAQGEEMVVAAKTNGMILMSGEHLTPGTSVAKGQVLLTVSGEGLADDNIGLKAEEARNNYLKAEADFERKTLLSAEKLIPEKELQEAKALYLNSKAIHENFRDNFRKSGQQVISPMSGFIREVRVQNGQYADAGQPLLVVSKDKNLVLTADVMQKYLLELRNIGSVTIRPVPGEKFFSLEELGGRILSVGKSLNPDNGMIPVTLQISHSGEFIPGGLAEIIFRCSTDQPVQTVPYEALMEEQGNFFVFVQRTPELFERREVIPGAADGLRVEILSGLKGEERVVTRGAVMVKLARTSGALDPHAGHVH